MEEGDAPRWMDMPSIAESQPEPIAPAQQYHDLGDLYPDAPVPMTRGEAIIHRAVLHDSAASRGCLTGLLMEMWPSLNSSA